MFKRIWCTEAIKGVKKDLETLQILENVQNYSPKIFFSHLLGIRNICPFTLSQLSHTLCIYLHCIHGLTSILYCKQIMMYMGKPMIGSPLVELPLYAPQRSWNRRDTCLLKYSEPLSNNLKY